MVFESKKGIYGSKKIAKELQKSKELEKACRNTVAKAIKEMGLKSKVSRRFRPTSLIRSSRRLGRTMQITCSKSRTGCCYDNAVAERFFWSLKNEWTKFESYENLEQAKISVFKYIETFYNRTRLHQTLNYQSPDQFEQSQKTPLVM